jgi:hypothetical protein
VEREIKVGQNESKVKERQRVRVAHAISHAFDRLVDSPSNSWYIDVEPCGAWGVEYRKDGSGSDKVPFFL